MNATEPLADDLSAELELAPRRPRTAPLSYRVMRRVTEYGRLARLLNPYGIRSRAHRLPNGDTRKGYAKTDFTQAWERYLPPAAEK